MTKHETWAYLEQSNAVHAAGESGRTDARSSASEREDPRGAVHAVRQGI